MPAPSVPDFDLSTDPRIQASLAELRQAVQAMQVEMEERRREIEAKAVAPAPEEVLATPQINPGDRAEFERIEAELGLPTVQPELQHQRDFSTQTIIQAVETVAGAVQERLRRPPPEVEPQWFYARGNQSHGPVPQSELLNLLQKRQLPWTTLVWRRLLKDWRPASETELGELEPGEPPPLPRTTKSPESQSLGAGSSPASTKCRACGNEARNEDRFCSSCGAALK